MVVAVQWRCYDKLLCNLSCTGMLHVTWNVQACTNCYQLSYSSASTLRFLQAVRRQLSSSLLLDVSLKIESLKLHVGKRDQSTKCHANTVALAEMWRHSARSGLMLQHSLGITTTQTAALTSQQPETNSK